MLDAHARHGGWITLAMLCVSCTARYPNGTIACGTDDDCPSGFTCQPRASSGELFCFDHAQATTANLPSMEAPDADAAVSGEPPTTPPDASTQDARSNAGMGEMPAATGGMAAGALAGAGAGGRAAGMGAQAGLSGQSGAAGQASSADAGVLDGGLMPACDPARKECERGATTNVMFPCGWCGSGTQTAARSCGDDCRWSMPVASGACMNVSAACEPGAHVTDAQTCACGRTQMRARTCSDSCEWITEDWGPCDLTGVECTPGASMPETRRCECGRTQTRPKACSDSCHWVTGAWSACDLDGVECKPGDSQTRTVDCATCGTRSEQRSCAADSCKWGAWSQLSAACASACEDCAEVQFCMAPSGQPNPGGTKCRQTLKACTHEQALADCNQDIPVVCGKATQPFYMQYL